ncbi:UNVERIFIED_CONTAM: hypothetical protein FKN15_057042 [Acipenser sinensis]
MALLHFSSALSILCCLLTAGGSALLEKNMAVLDEFSAFDWSNCGVNDPFVVNSLSISSPIRIPGPLTIGLSGTLKVPVHAPLKLEVEIKKKVWGIWFKLPCEDNYGSCTYNNVCEMLDKMFPEKTCPSTLQFHNVPCHCPVAPRKDAAKERGSLSRELNTLHDGCKPHLEGRGPEKASVSVQPEQHEWELRSLRETLAATGFKEREELLQTHQEELQRVMQEVTAKVEKEKTGELEAVFSEQVQSLKAEHGNTVADKSVEIHTSADHDHINCVSAQGSKYRGTVVEFPDFNPSSDAEVLYNAMKGLDKSVEIHTSADHDHINCVSAQGSKYRGTVVEFPDFNPSSDAEVLYNAMKGFGSDKETILELITSRSNAQRQEICAAYKSQYGKDLIGDLKYELTGKFERLIVGLMRPTAYHDAKEIKDAIKGIGTDEKCLIEILASRNNKQIHDLVNAYKDAYGRDLEADIVSDTSGHFKKMLVVLLQGTREEDDVVSEDLVEQDAQGLGTADNTLIRIMVSRAEIDMLDIREFFRLSYEKSLYNMIKDDTSGEYKRSLLKLCGGDDDLAGEFFPEAAQLAYKMWEVSSMARVELKGTVQPAANFNPDSDAQALRKAMKGFGTDEDTIIDIVTHRSNAQRQEILQKYKSLLGRDLMADLKSELSGSLCRLILGLMMTPAQFDAKMMRKAMEGAGTDEKALIEILTTRNNQEILAMNEAYKEAPLSSFLIVFSSRFLTLAHCPAYHKNLEDSITSDTSGHFCRVLVSLVQGSREEGPADLARAQEDAKELGDAVNDESTSMETKFLSILCTRSYPHLRKVFQEFVTCTNKDVEQVIRKEISGDLKTALIAIVRSIKNKPSYFADRLYKSMKGLGTDDRTLTRVMISRSEIDLFNIRREYKELHDVSLHESIKVEALCVSYIFIHYSEREMVTNHIGLGDTSGDYRKALLTLCGGED